uniref:SCD domain-containing protein n=1 Tax=Hyaloperonospora arabidopsidis (strain Emoy2) TaxID=559515 RepID=M4BEJ6_HYAAE
MEDVVNRTQEDLESANGEYWIMSRGRGAKKSQRNFEEFWEAFVSECYESDLLFAADVAKKMIDWLTTLSSSELRPIRHTCTVAVLALGAALVRTAASISEQLAIAKRQLKAETNLPVTTTPGTRKSPNVRKVALLKDNEALYENRLQQVLKLVNSIFTEVVVHRYRDVMPEIRVVSIQCLGHWITTLPDQFLKDNFLKYLGWCLSDKAAVVRLEVVAILCELYENDAFTERLEPFNSRFLPRYMELCNDVDDAVVEESIHLLIAIDKHNLISSDIELSAVEKLVFDAERNNIRKAAAEFVCLQYDAFGVAVSKTKNAQLKKEQLNTQAIALVEFAEEYTQNHGVPESTVETLVDAFWDAPDLSSEQQTILLRLLVASVCKLVGSCVNRGASAAAKRESEQLQEEITVAYCKDIPSLFVMYQADSDKLSLLLQLIPMLSLKSEIIGHHSNHIKELLEKLKHAFLLHSDEELLSSLSLSIAHLLQTEHTSLKREVEVTMHELVQEVMDKTDRLLEFDLKLYDTFATTGDDASTPRNKRARNNKKSATVKEMSDVEYALRIALCRLKCLVRYVNVRGHLPPDLSSMLEKNSQTSVSDPQQGRMEKLIMAIGELMCRRTKSVSELHEEFRHVGTITHGLTIMFFDLLWITLPIFETVAEKKARDSSENATEVAETAVDLSTQVQIQKVCRSRATLEEALISVLEMHLARPNKVCDDKQKRGEEGSEHQLVESMEEIDFEDEQVAAYVDDAQCFAFITFCDARCLFVEKFQEATAPYNALDWDLPKVLILLTQMYFERKMDEAEEGEPEFEDDMEQNDPKILKEKTDAIREWDQKQQRKAELLVALGRVSLCNPSKKHQAAAVLQYFTSRDKLSVEVVKAYGKQVKSDAPVRYLEIQMTSLRQLYSSILVWKQNIEAAESGNGCDQVLEEEDLQNKVDGGKQELKELARRFSQSLGVGKIPASLRVPFLRFLREGVRYSLEEPSQFEFLETMRVYLSHLDKSSMAQLSNYFMDQLQRVRGTHDDSGDLDPRWQAVLDFQSSIASGSVAKGGTRVSTEIMHSPPLKSRVRSASSEPTPMQTTSIAEEGEEEEENTRDAETGRESAAGDHNGSMMVAGGSPVEHHHRQGPPVHERTTVADHDTDSTQFWQNRKRRQGDRNEDPGGNSKVSEHSKGDDKHRNDSEHEDGEAKEAEESAGRTRHKRRRA